MNESAYIKDISPIVHHLYRFLAFVHHEDHLLNSSATDAISFTDTNGFLGMEEGYKSSIAEKAREELHIKDWKESWIGTGKIASKVSSAISKANNLVNKNQQINLKNRLNPAHASFRPDAERVLYEIYRGSDEKAAFEMAVNAFGAKYDTIAFLFFLKDSERFLPISSGNFDKSFRLLGIDFTTSFNCSWSNYCDFISIIRDIQALMDDLLPLKAPARLIDAHSFVWILHGDRFINWEPSKEDNQDIERSVEVSVQRVISGEAKRVAHTVHTYTRNAEVVKAAKARANGICQLCGNPAPFVDAKGLPYLEVHHVVWLSRGGKDSTDNVVALCPNCHTKMHVVDDIQDVNRLLQAIK